MTEQMDYQTFLENKGIKVHEEGMNISTDDINPILYPFQRDIVRWACRKGRAAIFANTGLGKTFMYLEWARLMGQTTLIVAPLSVAYQTIREAEKLGITVIYVKNDLPVKPGNIYITNYERIDKFRPELFGAVVLDESSILKNMSGKIRTKLIRQFADTDYRLCATATPAPNDINELGNHSEFLGHMRMSHMSSVFFVHDQKIGLNPTHRWRLKGHSKKQFYQWLASWAIAINFPSDLGYSDEGFILPPLDVTHKTVPHGYHKEGMLEGFATGGLSAIDVKRIRRATVQQRSDLIADMVNDNDDQWLIWCGLNDEAYALLKLVPDAVNIEGSMTPEDKAQRILEFQDGKIRVLITKIKIAGMGMNLQNSHKMVFHGLDYSWEGYYQAIRRQWRHGQKHRVDVSVVTSTHAAKVFEAVLNKEQEATQMTQELINVTKEYSIAELQDHYIKDWKYATDRTDADKWTMMMGDSVERMKEIPDNSLDLTVTSPPFSDLFIYSNSPRDLSNNPNIDEFFKHYEYIIRENLRATKPGRIACVHIQDVKAFKTHDGYRGLKNFPFQIIDAYIKAGWTYRSTVTVWKNPQIAAARNKDSDLLFITLKRDSTKLAPTVPDYLLVFRKPGENEVPVQPYPNEISEEDWILWAAPVWYGIKEGNVLNTRSAKGQEDEKHICPLQLDFIERCIKLYSNPGEWLFDPFAGIGSTGYEALRWGRKFVGIELKPEYYKVACHNLKNAESVNGPTLFDWAAQQQEEQQLSLGLD